jgi:lambda family phage minor tail protein L
MSDTIPELVQSLNPGAIVELYELDLTAIGYSQHYYFTPSSQNGNDLSFAGQQYTAAPVKITGFKKSSDGQSVQPEFIFPNVNKAGTGLLNTYNDLIGARIIRRRTFASFLEYLDDGVTPNPFADNTSQFIPEVWYVEQKTDHNRAYIKLCSRRSQTSRTNTYPHAGSGKTCANAPTAIGMPA